MDIKAYKFKSISRFFKNIKRSLIVLVLFLPFQNCGEFEAASSFTDLSSVAPSVFNCEASDPRNPNASELKRLNKFEITNTLNDLLAFYLNGSETQSIMNQLKPFIADIPKDHADEEMSHFDQSISSQHIDKQILLAEKLAELVVGNQNYLDKIAGTCSQDTDDANCLNSFIQDFGKKAYRRPLSSEDAAWFAETFAGHIDGYENTIAALLSSPYFIYHYDVGESFVPDTNSDVVLLDAYARASKLSYFYLQSLPDAELFEAAENRSILNSVGLNQQIERLMSKPIVRQRLNKFFADQLYKLEETPEYRTDIAAVNSMLSELSSNTDLNNRREHMVQEVYDYLDYIIWEKKSGFEELMTSDLVFPRTEDLAEIYGTPTWNGSYNEADLVRAPAGQRSGILTKAQLLFTGSSSTRPIMRGVRVFNEFLCGEIPPPADNDTPSAATVEDDFSEREVVTAITEYPGTSCVGCHQGIINPLGFPYEMFDSFGRWRTTEKVYHPETSSNKGQVLTTKAVDSRTEINLGDTIRANFTDAISVSQELAQNEKALACFNLKLWDFAAKQPYKLGQNDCATTALFSEMSNSKSIYETLKILPFQPEFFKRRIQ